MRIKKPKLFVISGKFSIDVCVKADSKEEALAWSQQEFSNFIVVNPDNNDSIFNVRKVLLKLKKPKRLSVSVEDAMNGDL